MEKSNDAPGKKWYIRNNNVNDAFGINNDTLVINTDALEINNDALGKNSEH